MAEPSLKQPSSLHSAKALCGTLRHSSRFCPVNPQGLQSRAGRRCTHTHTPVHTHYCKGKREKKQECLQCEEVRKDHRHSSFQWQDTLVRQRYSLFALTCLG